MCFVIKQIPDTRLVTQDDRGAVRRPTRVHDKILQTRKIKRQSVRQLLPLPSTGTTVREAHVSYGETKSWRAWEAIGLG
jgi:hypothetical protein